MRAASFLRMTNCNAFAGRFPCLIAEHEKWAPFLTLTLRDSQIWGTRFDRWMPWNEKCPLFLTLDLVEDMIWGVKLGYRPPGRAIWGSVLPFRPPRASNLGGRFTLPTTPSIKFGGHFRLSGSSEVKFGRSDWGIDLPGRVIWGSFLHHRPVRHPNLGVILASPTCPGIKSGGQDQGEQEGRSQIFFLFQKLLPHHFPTNKKN